MFAILYCPPCSLAVLSPSEVGRLSGDVLSHHVGGLGAIGYLVEGDVVHVAIPGRRGTQCTDGNVGAHASELVKLGDKLSPCSAAAGVDVVCCHQLEGVYIRWVGHHTHVHYGVIAGAAGLGPEFEPHGIHIDDVGIDRRQHDIVVVAIRARGGGTVPVKSHVASRSMVVRGGVGNVRIAHIGCAVVQVVPATDKGVVGCGVRCGGLAFEGLHEGECRQTAALGRHTDGGRHAGVVAAANGANAK